MQYRAIICGVEGPILYVLEESSSEGFKRVQTKMDITFRDERTRDEILVGLSKKYGFVQPHRPHPVSATTKDPKDAERFVEVAKQYFSNE